MCGSKHVELSEYNPFEALNTNVLGTNNVNASIKNRVKKVLLTSSDKAVNPGTMGIIKLLAEKLLISANNFQVQVKAIWLLEIWKCLEY